MGSDRVNGSGKVTLECIVTLQNRSQTHSQVSTQASKLQSAAAAAARSVHTLIPYRTQKIGDNTLNLSGELYYFRNLTTDFFKFLP